MESTETRVFNIEATDDVAIWGNLTFVTYAKGDGHTYMIWGNVAEDTRRKGVGYIQFYPEAIIRDLGCMSEDYGSALPPDIIHPDDHQLAGLINTRILDVLAQYMRMCGSSLSVEEFIFTKCMDYYVSRGGEDIHE